MVVLWAFLLFELTSRAASSSSCPSGVRPGEYYATPDKIWQVGRGQAGEDRCFTHNYGFPTDNSLKCADWLPPGAQGSVYDERGKVEGKCAYSSLEHGGYWCALTPSTNSSCVVEPGEQRNSEELCVDPNKCIEPADYGICWCEQCPCSHRRQFGQDCNLCSALEGEGCGPECQYARGVHPGQHYRCVFDDAFLKDGRYNTLFIGNVAQPTVEVDILPNGFNLRVYWSHCTLKEQLMVAVNFTDCKTGVFVACQAQSLPTPCYKCGTSVSITYPEGSFLPQSTRDILSLVGLGGTMFGCRPSGDHDNLECSIYYDAFPLDWGYFRCRMGTECVFNSTNGSVINETTVYEDAEASEMFVVYLMLGTLLFFIMCVAIVCFGARYTFGTAAVALDIAGLQLEWDALCVGDIISNLKGRVAPGSLVAVLGPIGAGKSTLLKTLCGRIAASSGGVYVNGSPKKDFELRKLIGFVPQEDMCCPDDTVAEAIGFAAAMSNGKFPELHPVLKEKLYERISNLSGGQRRMANVYVELARLPQALLLDEPTTGLDSYSACELMKVLKQVSQSIPVLATMHQPGPDVADYIDEVSILADGEEVCYAGSAELGKKAVPELQALIEKSGKRPPGERLYAMDVAIDLAYEGVKLGCSTVHAEEDKNVRSKGPDIPRQISNKSVAFLKKAPEIPRQLFYIGIRNIKRALRRNRTSLIVTAGGSMLIGFCYWQADNTLNGIRNRFGTLFMLHAFLALQAVGATSVTPAVAALTEHEIDSFVYLRVVDAFGKVSGQFFGQLPHAIIVSAIVYTMVGLRGDGSRPVVFCICVTACAVGNSFTALCARHRNQTYVGMIRACTVNGVMLFFCGFLLGNSSVPDSIMWGKEISPIRYSFEMLLAHELIGLRSVFNPIDADPIPTRGGIYLQQYGMVHKIDDEFYDLGYKLGWLTAIWMVAAFIVLLLPSAVCCEHRRFRPVRKKGEGQLDILLNWLERQVIPETLDAKNATYFGVTDSITPLDGLKSTSEICWKGLGNADTRDLSGGLRAGTLLGVVGPCGSGKSTLLTMLTGRVSPASGQIFIGSQAKKHRQLAALVGYVPQVNHLCQDDTLREALEFAAKVGGHTQLAQAGNQGQQRIRELSGGQQRVAAVAVELARRPCLLALDEPLSGLDGASCMKLAHLLKRISQTMPVIITLHQPRPELTSLLSHVMVMHHGQLCVSLPYLELSHLSARPAVADKVDNEVCIGLQSHEGSVPEERPMLPTALPPGELLLEQADNRACREPTQSQQSSEPNATTERVSKSGITVDLDLGYEPRLHANGTNGNCWADSKAPRPLDRILATIEEYVKSPKLSEYQPTKSVVLPSRRHRMSFRLFRAVLGREIRRLWMQRPLRSAGVLLFWIAAGLLSGIAYSNMEGGTTLGVLQRCGLFFVLNAAISILTLPRVFFFFEVRKTVMHELESQIISPFFYHACHSLADFTQRLPCALLFCITVLYLAPLQDGQIEEDQDDGKYPILILTVICTAMSCACLADAITAFSRDHLQASSAYAGVVVVLMLFSAKFVAVDSRQVEESRKTHADAVSVLTHCSLFFYSWQALIENELSGGQFAFKISGIKTATLSGEEWLKQLDVPARMSSHILIVVAWGVLFWFLAGLGLMYQTLPRRRSALPV